MATGWDVILRLIDRLFDWRTIVALGALAVLVLVGLGFLNLGPVAAFADKIVDGLKAAK